MRWFCPTCDVALDEGDVVERGEGRSHVLVRRCSRCQGLVERGAPRARGPYWQALLGALAYPAAPTALVHIAGYGVISGGLSIVPVLGPVLTWGLVITYLSLVVRTSVLGQPGLPAAELPDHIGDYFGPVLRFLLSLALPFTPALVLSSASDGDAFNPFFAALVVLGFAYLPASVLLSAHGGTLLAPFNFVGGFQLISRIPGPYALTCLAVAAVLLASDFFGSAVAPIQSIRILGAAAGTVVSLPFFMVAARMLGLLVFHHADELGLDD